MLQVGWVGWMGWDGMVIIGHRSSKSTFGANKVHWVQCLTWTNSEVSEYGFLDRIRIRIIIGIRILTEYEYE